MNASVLLVLLVVVLVSLGSVSAHPYKLKSGQSLTGNQFLESPNKLYEFILQASDGNLVLQSKREPHEVYWSAGVSGADPILEMQSDCNLVAYVDREAGNAGAAYFATNTVNADGPCYLQVQTDRNVVLYDANGAPLWATNTAV